MNEFIKGVDVGSLIEEERNGARFFDHGKEGDALKILRRYGINYMRIRIWNDPYDSEGRPYGGGSNDLEHTLQLARRANALGMGILLDFQYSDYWADPQKQTCPKAWQDLSPDEIEEKVRVYTAEVMLELKKQGTLPTMVQVGNEITNGLIWPYGKKPDFDAIARLVSAGIRGVRDVDPVLPVMIHLDNGGNNPMYREWFDEYMKRGEDFQIIGLSYYPFWHGTLDGLSFNMKDMAERYGKQLAVAEVSMGFSLEDYRRYEVPAGIPGEDRSQWISDHLIGCAASERLAEKLPWPMTVQGQCSFMAEFVRRVREVPQALGYFYWEPAWVPVPGVGWCTPEGLAYTGESGKDGNEWANQALFDYDGNALPALETIRDC